MSRYWIAKHAYVCAVDQQVVVLDLRRNKYLTVPTADSVRLDEVVAGWPRTKDIPRRMPQSGLPEALLHKLASMHLITMDAACGNNAATASVVSPEASIIESALVHTLLNDAAEPPGIKPIDIIGFIWAWLKVRRRLHVGRLEDTVADSCAQATRLFSATS